MNRLLKYLTPKTDKLAHYFTGEYPALAGLLIYFVIWDNYISLLILSVLAGIYKEIIHDKMQGKGKVEFLDFWYTFLPALRNLILILTIKYI